MARGIRLLAATAALAAGLAVGRSVWAQNDPSRRDSPELSELFSAAQAASEKGDSAKAAVLLNAAIKLDPQRPDLYRWRGRELFRLGKIDDSLADFDRVAKLAPNLEKSLWERGISYYYAGRFAAGARQFELYQTYHDADVENAAWRYLCIARDAGVDKARESLLAIKNDSRVPMMKIYDLYRGQATPDDVITAAKAGEPNDAELHQRLFYAHLYIGLYHEAAGDAAKAKEQILLAANRYRIGHYMGDVARVHAAKWEAE